MGLRWSRGRFNHIKNSQHNLWKSIKKGAEAPF
ncbi:uncharacterized protein METZ01_LOCUS433378 [marine metagenome]|uniref:Uncharacterized protein n=1 Tax=marine metagenome TaxID=408172 RepID=A0A382YBE1_9ZZZZ